MCFGCFGAALCYRTVVCLSCLSVTLICCGQTVGWIKMKLGLQVGHGPGHIVLDVDPTTPLPKGHSPSVFDPCLLWPNGCMDQDGTWHGGRSRSRPHCVRWGPSSPPQQGAESPQFSAHFYCCQTASCMKMPLGMEVGLGPSHIVLDVDQTPPPQKKGRHSPQFSAYVYCGQTAVCIRIPLSTEVGLGPGHIVLDGDPDPTPLP